MCTPKKIPVVGTKQRHCDSPNMVKNYLIPTTDQKSKCIR